MKREIGRGRSHAVTAREMYQNCAAHAKLLLLAVRVDGWIHLQHTHIAVVSAPWSVLLFSSFNVIQRVRNSTGRCEGCNDTRMLQTMKNYCCLRPRGCFDSQILEDKAEHNFEHGVILLNSWSSLFCSLSVENMKLLKRILSFMLLQIIPRSQIQSNLP